MAGKTPRVSEGRLYDPRRRDSGIAIDSPAWLAWLESPEASSFSYPVFVGELGYIVGFVTVRKEQRQRGAAYWVAYRRQGPHLRKAYVGPAAQVTRARLDAIVARWQADVDRADEHAEEDAGPTRPAGENGQARAAESTSSSEERNVLSQGGIPPAGSKRTLRAVWRWRRVNRATGRGFTRPRPW